MDVIWFSHYNNATLSAVTKTYLKCNFSILFFKDWTERLVCHYLYKCGCFVKLSTQISMIFKISSSSQHGYIFLAHHGMN